LWAGDNPEFSDEIAAKHTIENIRALVTKLEGVGLADVDLPEENDLFYLAEVVRRSDTSKDLENYVKNSLPGYSEKSVDEVEAKAAELFTLLKSSAGKILIDGKEN